MKRFFSLILALVMVLTMFTVVCAAEAELSSDAKEAETAAEPASQNPAEYTVAAANTQKLAMLINCDQMDFICRDGTRQGFHTADEDSERPWNYMNMVYCLESGKGFSVGPGHYGSDDLSIDGVGTSYGEKVWYNLSADQRVAIGLILLYGAPTKLWAEEWGLNAEGNHNMHNPNIGYRYATQVLIWEITGNMRSATPPYTRTAASWYDGAIGCCMSEDGMTDHFKNAYESIVNDLQQHNTIPSFTADIAALAPEIQLTETRTTLTDTNGVLHKFSFTDTSGISFIKDGHDLIITVNGAAPGDVQTATATLPSAEASLYEVWFNPWDASKQVCIKLSVPASDPVPAYFKLDFKRTTGTLTLQKSTEDGQHLDGWQFCLYADSDCTQLLSGPHTTDEYGNIFVADLDPGDIWVREEGHVDAEVNAAYVCESQNPTKVTISAEKNTPASFHNRLRKGTVKIIKTLEDSTSGSVKGWTFGISSTKEENGEIICNHIATGVTDENGIILQDLDPGEYIITEVLEEGSPWRSVNGPSQIIQVRHGETTEVSFVNALRSGNICIHKVDTFGNPLAGVEFLLEWSSDGTSWCPVGSGRVGSCTSPNLNNGKIISGPDGIAVFDGLNPILLYRLTETKTLPGYEPLTETAYEGCLPEHEGFSLTLTVVNAKGFHLPDTGKHGFQYIPAVLILGSFCLFMAFLTVKKKDNL